MQKKAFKNFIIPHVNRRFIIRLIAVVAGAYIFFGHICIPTWIRGASMVPTYPERGFTFCWTPAYWFSEPERGDIVIIRMAGKKVMLLKRVIALEGDTVSFQHGVLHVNGEAQAEPYVTHRSRDWNMQRRKVKSGHVYLIGDNRGMAMEEHTFGQTSKKRIKGMPLW